MPYRLSLPDQGDYLCLTWSGVVSEAELATGRQQSIQRATDEQLNKLLIDIRGVSNRPQSSVLINNAMARTEPRQRQIRTALLARSDQAEDAGVVRSVADLRNFPLETFQDLNVALRWLNR